MGNSGVGNSAQRGMIALKGTSFILSRPVFPPAAVVKAGNPWYRALLTNLWGGFVSKCDSRDMLQYFFLNSINQ